MTYQPKIRIEDITMACPSCSMLIDVMQQRDTGCDYCVEDWPEDIHEQPLFPQKET